MDLKQMSDYLLGRGYDPYIMKQIMAAGENPNNWALKAQYGESTPENALYEFYNREFNNPNALDSPGPAGHSFTQMGLDEAFSDDFELENPDSRDYLNMLAHNVDVEDTGWTDPNLINLFNYLAKKRY